MSTRIEPAGRGMLLVLSAPSGTGKSTLARRLLEEIPELEFSVSYTTRPRRAGEEDGRQYHFVDDARFDAMVAAGEFVEWADVFGRRYGTGRSATERSLAAGRDVLLDIDVQGAAQIRRSTAEAVAVFVLPPDFATLESRLRARASDDEDQVRTRLALAGREASEFVHYDYVVVNDDLERAVSVLRAIVVAERRRVTRCESEAERVLSTFPR